MVTISSLCGHTQELSKKCIYALCAGFDKEETGCTRTSAADTLDLQQVSDGVHGVSKLGRMDLMFIDARVKINGAYYREVLLTQKLLPVMREICGEFYIFERGNFYAHRACETINLLKRDSCVHFTRPFATQQHKSE